MDDSLSKANQRKLIELFLILLIPKLKTQNSKLERMDQLIKEIDPEGKVLNDVQKFEEIVKSDNYNVQHEFAIRIVEEYNLSEILYLSLGFTKQHLALMKVFRFYDAQGRDIRALFLNRYFEKFNLLPRALLHPFSSFYVSLVPVPYLYKDIEFDLNFIQDFKKTSDITILFEIYQRIFDMHIFIINGEFTYQETKWCLASDFMKLIKVVQYKIYISPYIRLTLASYLCDKPSLAELIPEMSETFKILEQHGIFKITEDLLKFVYEDPKDLELLEVLKCWSNRKVKWAIISMFLATKTSLEDTSEDISGDDVSVPKQLVWEITQMPGYERFIKKYNT